MKACEKFLVALCAVSAVQKVAGIEGGAILTFISFFALSIFYAVFGFAVFNSIPFARIFKPYSYDGFSVWRITGTIAAGIVLATIVVGIFFQLLRWMGDDEMIIIALFLSTVVVVVALVRYQRTKQPYYTHVFGRLVIASAFGILSLLV